VSNVHADTPELRETVALACRVLAHRGLVEGVLGHVSARVAEDELVVRCRRDEEPGLAASSAEDVWRLDLDGNPVDLPAGAAPPKELPIHAELMRARPEVGCVIHAHPRNALLVGLAGLEPRPVFGAYNIPALMIARRGVPVFGRSVLVTRADLAEELIEAMGEEPVCVMVGHGITVTGPDVEAATVLAVNLESLLRVTVELAMIGAEPPLVPAEDLAELPDLGSEFNDRFAWQALVAELPTSGRVGGA